MPAQKYFTEQERKEAVRGYKKAYVKRNPDKRKQSIKTYDETHREQFRKYYEDNRDHIRKRVKENVETRKAEFLAMYGDKCECCGETEKAFLTVDHVKGQKGVPRDKKERGITLYRNALAEYRPDLYRVFCMNCNFATRFEGSICPHQKEYSNDNETYPRRR